MDKSRKREKPVRTFLLRDIKGCGILSSGSLQELKQQLFAHIPISVERYHLDTSFQGAHT